MKVKEIRELTTAEMLDQEKQLKETARIKEVRKSIARIKTVLREQADK